MAGDSRRLEMDAPCDQPTFRAQIVELARANRRDEGMARVVWLRNGREIWSSGEPARPVDWFVFTRELPERPAVYRLRLQPQGVYSAGVFAGVKMLSWAPNAVLAERARRDGFDDVLLLNERGNLVECTSANFFLVREGRVLTPPLSSGCLPGVTREVLLELAVQRGLTVVEKELGEPDLEAAEEAFISSSTRGVAPVAHIAPARNYGAPGPATGRFAALFRQFVEHAVRSRG